MNHFARETDDVYATGLRLLTVGGGVVVLVTAVYLALLFSVSELAVLGLTSFLAALISRYELRLPWKKIEFAAKNVFALWGNIWLGIAGGCLIGTAASAASCYRSKRDPKNCIFQICSDALSTFLGGIVYIYASGNSGSYSGRVMLPQAVIGFDDVPAIFLMAATHFVASSALSYLGRRILGGHEIRQLVEDTLLRSAVSYGLALAATLVANYTFVKFGIGFGWVMLPISVVGVFVHTIHTQRLESKTRIISEASRIHLATVEALATAIDARDQVGIGHVRRTQLFAIGIGELLSLSESEISALRTGALLHDIGKLAVPDHILNKPGPLTPAESEKTKIHASVGASILEKVGFDTPVVPTVKYHHENWDGSGYPEALRGENIPLTARILAVADAYDTLRGARPYRPAISRKEACAALRKEAGRKFDPMLVRLFIENLDYFELEIQRQGLGYRIDRGEALLDNITTAAGPMDGFVEQIKLANREAITLYELAREFSSSLDLAETLALFTEKISEFVPFDTCAVYLLDEKSRSAKAIHAEGLHKDDFLGREFGIGESVTLGVLVPKKYQNDPDHEGELDGLPAEISRDYRSMVSLPLVADEQLIGAVSLYSSILDEYGEEHLRLLETIAHIASDAIRKAHRHAEAENFALTDPMTGLPNARSLQVQFEREAARSMRLGTSFQLLMLDLDGFKNVNDTFGHKAGDKMLTEVGKIIRSQLRDYDFLARYAGDEFVALVPESTTSSVFDLCRRIEQSVKEFELVIGDSTATVGVSVGSASFPHAAKTFDQLLIAADKAMYAAKMIRKQNEKYKALRSPEKPKLMTAGATAHRGGSAGDVDDITQELLIEIDESDIVSASIN